MTKDGAASALDTTQLVTSLFALLPIPVAVTDDHGRVVMANSCFNETFQGVSDVSKLHQHEAESPGRGIFEIRTLPLNDRGLKMVYAVDVANEVELRRQVVHLEKMAAIGRLVTGVATELNNPLSDIRSYVPLAASCDMDATARKVFDVVFNQAARAGDVVKNLLTLAGKAGPKRETIDLNEIVRSIAAVRGYAQKASRFDVNFSLEPFLPYSVGDPTQVEQVILTLLMNAEAAVGPLRNRPGQIELRTCVRGRRIQLHVTDNGISRDVTRAFDSNQNGVGLSICSEIVKDHNGDLYAWSSYGNGSTFTLELPVSDERGQMQGALAAGSCLRDKKVMVIDDQIHITELIFDVLVRYGARVQIASSGSEAFDQLCNNEFDLIICDQCMPGLSGEGLYRLVERARPNLYRRFVFMSGNVLDQHDKQFLADAGLQFLKKPFRIQELLDAIDNAFNRSQPQDS